MKSHTRDFFQKEIYDLCGVTISRCIQCKGCTGVCHFSDAMDYSPHKLMRMLQLGMRDQVLSSNTIWICVGCHSCSNQCPQAIDIVTVMDVLRQIALEERRRIPLEAILNFHRSVLQSISNHGRTHKLDIMLRFKAATGRWLQDLDLGIKMLAHRKLDLTPSRVDDLKEVRQIFKRHWEP